MNTPVTRREFLSAATVATFCVSSGCRTPLIVHPQRLKAQPTPRVRAVFLYPSHEKGQVEDQWAQHRWFTWPGNQFQPEQQRAIFEREVGARADRLGVAIEWTPEALDTVAAIESWAREARRAAPDALLVVNF